MFLKHRGKKSTTNYGGGNFCIVGRINFFGVEYFTLEKIYLLSILERISTKKISRDSSLFNSLPPCFNYSPTSEDGKKRKNKALLFESSLFQSRFRVKINICAEISSTMGQRFEEEWLLPFSQRSPLLAKPRRKGSRKIHP